MCDYGVPPCSSVASLWDGRCMIPLDHPHEAPLLNPSEVTHPTTTAPWRSCRAATRNWWASLVWMAVALAVKWEW